MPLLKSPSQILKVWKRATTEYLKLNQLKELPNDEKVWATKFIPPMERLRKLAQQRTGANRIPALLFASTRADCLTPIEKLRKLFKPRKGQAKVKKYYMV